MSAAPVADDVPMRYGDGDWAMHDGGWWWMGLLWIVVLVVVAALAVWVVVTVVRGQQGGTVVGGRARPVPPADPAQILAERLARGDIDPDEYRARLEALREAQGP